MNDWYINSILNSKPTLFHLACSVALMCDMAQSPPGNSRFPPRGPHRVEPLPAFEGDCGSWTSSLGWPGNVSLAEVTWG